MVTNPQAAEPDYQIVLAVRTFDPAGEPLIPPSDEPTYHIVQFTKPLTTEERSYIQSSYQLSLKYYIPNFAFLERLDNKTWSALSKDPLHRASAFYQPSDKISPEIGDPDEAWQAESEGILLRALIFPETTDEAISNIIKVIESLRVARGRKGMSDSEAGQQHIEEESGPTSATEDSSINPSEASAIIKLDDRNLGGHFQLIFTLPSTESLLQIAQIQEVQWIEKVTELNMDARPEEHCTQENLVAGTIQSGAPGVTPIWDNGINGRNLTIGIIEETLINLDHCMFKDDALMPIGTSHRKLVGFRRAGGHLDAHATVVASVAAGDEVNNSGLNKNRGIAWAAKLSFDDLTVVKIHEKSLIQVLDAELHDGATIHSNSWNDDTRAYNKTAVDVDTFVWRNENQFVCGATANRDQNKKLGPPGTAKNALCVSASQRHPQHLLHGNGKSGPTRDGRRKPEICAPGCGINAATTDKGCLCSPHNDCVTSWATPVIAGAAALVSQYYLEGWHHAGVKDLSQSHLPSAALIKATLLNSTVPMENVTEYPSDRTGWGLVKLSNTLFFKGGPRNLFFEDVYKASGLETDQRRVSEFKITRNDEPLKITLVWSDPPATIGTGKVLVNDLNLIVTSPDGNVYRGNNFSGGFSSSQTAGADDHNNVEMVIIKDPVLGTWSLIVEGAVVNIWKQGYALVVTGSLS